MAQQLSTDQVLLLENLMYMTSDEPLRQVIGSENKTVEQLISSIDINKLESNKDYGSYMTGNDWKNIITAIKQDDQILNMQIVNTNVDKGANGGGGASALFVDPSTKEAVVAFRGTAGGEWKDNFTGGGKTDAADGVSTFQQENALEWYQSLGLDDYDSITVTGHSKGGNKAKYITIMDDSVDRCISFDGQGFSDEFIEKYGDQIAANQGKIANHNVDSDYVNLLLNDVGDTTFYNGCDYGEGGFLENHCPNTFLDFKPDGTVQMTVGERDSRMAELDAFLNNYLRTLSPEDKQKTLLMIGELVEGGFNGAGIDEILDIMLTGDNVDYAANLAAYLLKYKDANPQLVDTIKDVLNEMGMDNITRIIDIVDGITGWKHFDKIMNGLGWVSGHIPTFVYEWLSKYLKEKGIELSEADLKKLIGLLQTMADDMDEMEIADNGADIVVPTKSEGMQAGMFNVQPAGLDNIITHFDKNHNQMMDYIEVIRNTRNMLGLEYFDVKMALKILEKNILQQASGFKEMGTALDKVNKRYQKSERKIINGCRVSF